MTRDFFLGFIRIHILYHADKEPVYGLYLIDELARHGYRLSPGTLYPILAKLEKARLVVSKKKTVKGKVRKYYRITPRGRKTLNEAKEKIKELIKEVIENNY